MILNGFRCVHPDIDFDYPMLFSRQLGFFFFSRSFGLLWQISLCFMARFVLSVVGGEPLPLKRATNHIKKVLLLTALDASIIMMWLT